MNEAINTTTINCTYERDIEPALYDLAGLASVAAMIFDAFREQPERCDRQSANELMDWLHVRLSSAAENALAIHERRAPRWNTTMEADAIKAALERAGAIGREREARTEARIAEVAAERKARGESAV